MLPKIIITGEEGLDEEHFYFLLSQNYSDAIAAAGSIPFVALDYMHTEDYETFGDGLLLTGGMDVHAYRYGGLYATPEETPPTCTSRDNLDFLLCEKFLKAKKPVFGIGRGLAVINTVLGGTLYQDLERELSLCHRGAKETKEKFELLHHRIQTEKGSLMEALLGDSKIVNSCHHTGIKALGKGLSVTARSEDGVIEAVEHDSLPVFAVQWHPEKKTEGYDGDPVLFRHFVERCKEVAK